jgi:hypothetical protein
MAKYAWLFVAVMAALGIFGAPATARADNAWHSTVVRWDPPDIDDHWLAEHWEVSKNTGNTGGTGAGGNMDGAAFADVFVPFVAAAATPSAFETTFVWTGVEDPPRSSLVYAIAAGASIAHSLGTYPPGNTATAAMGSVGVAVGTAFGQPHSASLQGSEVVGESTGGTISGSDTGTMTFNLAAGTTPDDMMSATAEIAITAHVESAP